MYIFGINYAQIAVKVWSQATGRTLTSLGSGSVAPVGGMIVAVPAASTVTLRPAVGELWAITIVLVAQAGGQLLLALTDGVTPVNMLIVAAGATGTITMNISRNQYVQFTNQDAALIAAYSYSGYKLIQ